jgi:hypothetical protein
MDFNRKHALVTFSILGATAIVASAALFQPWKLFIDTEVQEEIPTTQEGTPGNLPSETKSPGEDLNDSEPSEEATPSETSTEAEPIVLSEGELISHEHKTTGTVKILQLADGSRILRLEDLSTSDGPRVEVWLTDAPVIEGLDGWFVFDDGNYQSLGAIKGNKGSQNYKIPADLDVSDFTSVSLWCVTFAVSFGAAALS